MIFFFLANIRTTVISALAIPTSIISAFAVVYYMGFTLNSITLLALALSVGIVIDDAIVVLENIYRFIEEKDCTPFEAAFAATKEIGLAVLSITLSLMAVFLPIAFMGGIVGRFLKSFGVTMSATILVSMIVSFSLTPMLAARWLKLKRRARPAAARPGGDGRRATAGRRPLPASRPAPEAASTTGSKAATWRSCGSRSAGAGSSCCAWSACWPCCRVLLRHVRKNFLPDDDQSEFEIERPRPEGTSLEATFVILDRISRDVRRLGGVEYTLTSVADSDQRIANEGTVYVRMVPIGRRRFDQFEMMDYVRQRDPAALSQRRTCGSASARRPSSPAAACRRPTCSS